MSDAPAVTYPVGRGAWLAGLLGLPWLAGVAAGISVLFWAPAQVGTALTASLLIASLVISAAAAVFFWRSQVPRRLVWDGERWGLDEGGGPQGDARVDVRLDLQHALLLRYQDTDAQRQLWLWAEAASDRQRWHLLRCALYSSLDSTARTELGAVAERA